METRRASQSSPSQRTFGQEDFIGAVLGMVAIGGLLWVVLNDPVWPDTPVWLAGCFPPMMLIGIRTFRRWMRPDRISACWPANSPRPKQLTRATVGMMSAGAVLMCLSLALRGSEHPMAGQITGSLFLACEIWGYVIQRYNKDRSFEPASEGTSTNWTSPEHWQEPAISAK